MENKEKKFWNNKGYEIYINHENTDSSSELEFNILREYDWENKDILEIGIGMGGDLEKFQKLGANLNAIDISQKFIDRAQKTTKGNYFIGDVRDIKKIINQKMDLIYSRWSLIHLNPDEFKDVLAKLSDTLKADGLLLITLRRSDKTNKIHSKTQLQSLGVNLDYIKQVMPKNLTITTSHVSENQDENDEGQIIILFKKVD